MGSSRSVWVSVAVRRCVVDVVVASELVQFGDARNCDSHGYGQSRDIDKVRLE